MKNTYIKSFINCALLFAAGAVLQLSLGSIDGSFLKNPWGLIIAINYLYLLILAYAKSDRWEWVKRIYGHQSMTAVMTFTVFLTIIFGIIPQDGSSEGTAGILGFRNMVSSWPFCLIILYLITALGLQTIDDIHHIRSRRTLPSILHAAVFIVMASVMFSNGEKQRVRITAPIGHPVHTGKADDGTAARLPFVVTLKNFSMDEYPPKLYLIDPSKGTSSEDYLLVEEGAEGCIEGWNIKVLKSLDMAGRLPDSDEYKEMKHVGATSAVYAEAVNVSDGSRKEGWISCGSHIFNPAMLMLSDEEAIAMPTREPKGYLSEITVNGRKGEKEYSVMVNNPAKVGSWKIYQVGYDTGRGRWSSISILECVKDGWAPVISTGLWIILAGGVAMALTAGGRKRKNKE